MSCPIPLRDIIWYIKGSYFTTFEMAALRWYPKGENLFDYPIDFPIGNQTVISLWITFTYKDRVYKMCFECGKKHKKMGKHKIILYGKKIILNSHDLLVYAKYPGNWCHLCLLRSLFRIDDRIHKAIDQQIEFELQCLVCAFCGTETC